MEFKKILVPVDFSPCATKALKQALELARAVSARLDVLHVMELPHYVVPDVLVEVPGTRKQTLTEFARGEAERELDALLAKVETDDLDVRKRLEVGYPRDEILSVAEADGFDLVVMGTHGRTGLSRWFLGSIAEQVVRRAPCAVLTVRPDENDEANTEVSQ